MRLGTRVAIGLTGAAAWLLVLGFMLFAASVMREPADGDARADGIVVLTGTDQRIVAGARLLREGRAARMLISGVNRKTTRDDVLRISGLDDARFTCCVDLGYEALDTAGNAEEARGWASQRGYRRLIVVTSNYHMPRSLLVFRLAMPNIDFIPYPVPTKAARPNPWWLHVNTTRVLVAEYLKYLPTAAWLAANRLLHSSSASSRDAGEARRQALGAPAPALEVK